MMRGSSGGFQLLPALNSFRRLDNCLAYPLQSAGALGRYIFQKNVDASFLPFFYDDQKTGCIGDRD